MSKPHILIIPPWFDIGFAHHFSKNYHRWARDLSDIKQVQVGLLYGEFHTGVRKKVHYEKKGLNYQYLGVKGWGLPKIGPGWHIWEKQYLKAFDEYTKRHGYPTIIHGFSLLGLIAAGMIHQHHHIPIAYTEVLGSFIAGNTARRLIRKAGSYVKKASVVCGISPGMVSALEKTFDVPVKTIPVYIDNEIFFPANTPVGPPKFISIGSPARTKGMDILIHAMAILRSSLPEAQLTLVDDIPEQRWLESLIRLHALKDCVRFTGAVSHNKITGLLHEHHVLVSASRYESFGYTMAEALSCGRPVVASQTAGSTYIIQNNMGKIVPQEDPVALAKAMIRVYQHRKEYIPSNLHLELQSRFSKKKVLDKWVQLYHNLSINKGFA